MVAVYLSNLNSVKTFYYFQSHNNMEVHNMDVQGRRIMKWIIYTILSLAKLIIICGLVLLSVLVLPIIALLLALGISLSYMRDNESKFYDYKLPSLKLNGPTLTYFKLYALLLPPRLITRVQHIRILRNKSIY